MIRPAALFNKGRFARDFASLGRILAVACGNSRITREDLNDAELSHLEELENESDEMDKQVDEQKARWAQRQREKRARDKKMSPNVTVTPKCHGDSHDVTQCHGDIGDSHDVTILPTYLPTNHTLSNESVNTRSRGDVPDFKTVITVATSMMGVEESFARWWYQEMVARDWTTSKGGVIDNRNWRAQLKAWHNRATPQELAEINGKIAKAEAAKPKEIKAEDWVLCAERCANYSGLRCSGGCIMPPNLRPNPIPPEECQYFKGVNNG